MSADKPRVWSLSAGESIGDYRVFDLIRHRLHHRTDPARSFDVHTLRTRDWCSVIPVGLDGRITMVRQHRFGIDADSLEVPGGIIDEGEAPIDAAIRELREETGLVSGDVVSLGSVFANPPLMPTRLHIFLARDCRSAPEGQSLDETEELDVVHVTRDELDDAIDRGEIGHALVWAALFAWRRFEDRARKSADSATR